MGNVYAALKALTSSRRTLVLPVDSNPAERGYFKIRRSMQEAGDGMSRSEDLPPICSFEDLESKIPVVALEYMTVKPAKTREELDEELLWDEYTRMHSPAKTVVWDELLELGNEESMRTEDVTEDELDTVVLYQAAGTRRKRVEGEKEVRDPLKVEDVCNSQSRTKGPKGKPRWDFLLRFARMMGSLVMHEV